MPSSCRCLNPNPQQITINENNKSNTKLWAAKEQCIGLPGSVSILVLTDICMTRHSLFAPVLWLCGDAAKSDAKWTTYGINDMMLWEMI